MDDIDVLRQMYSTAYHGADDALAPLKSGGVRAAMETLRLALMRSQPFCLFGAESLGELAKYMGAGD